MTYQLWQWYNAEGQTLQQKSHIMHRLIGMNTEQAFCCSHNITKQVCVPLNHCATFLCHLYKGAQIGASSLMHTSQIHSLRALCALLVGSCNRSTQVPFPLKHQLHDNITLKIQFFLC